MPCIHVLKREMAASCCLQLCSGDSILPIGAHVLPRTGWYRFRSQSWIVTLVNHPPFAVAGGFLRVLFRLLRRGRFLDTFHGIRSLLTEAFGIKLPNEFPQGSFQGSWSWLSNFPSFFGFIPSSRAI